MSDCIAPDKVNEAFLAAPPLIAQQILDLTIKHPNWLGSIYEMGQWPTGSGTVMEQLVFRGALPQIERGFDKWKKIGNLSGCTPCEAPDCSYNWTTFGGHGFERKLTELMQREFRSPSYCINEIQTTAHFKEVFAKIVEGLYRQVDFFKEFNIGQNILTELAKKYIVDSDGAKPNTNNLYVYRPAGTARLSTLNIEMLEFFYEHLRRLPDCVPYDVVDGSPIYALECSHQLLARLYRDDANLRQDVRFSGMANDLLMKYNFMSTIRGMYIAAPILYPRRFNLTAVTGEPVEVLPFINDIPAEVGVYSYLNPNYEAATHEEVLIHGKFPFKVFEFPTEASLGGGSSFGPEPTFMQNWQWVNPLTECDPFRRVGYFATAAKLGVSQQFSEGIFGILVERPRTSLMAAYTPSPVCPPVEEDCDNSVPAVDCPCPVVISINSNPFYVNRYIFVFATGIAESVGHSLTLQYRNGSYVTGTIIAITTDGKTVELEIAGGLDNAECSDIIGVLCAVPAGACSSRVLRASDCRSNQTGTVDLLLENAIIARAVGADIIAYFGDCTTATLDVVAVDGENLIWTVQYATGYGPTDDPTGEGATLLSADMICDRGGIIKVCVPPSVFNDCPACEPSLTECTSPDYDYENR